MTDQTECLVCGATPGSMDHDTAIKVAGLALRVVTAEVEANRLRAELELLRVERDTAQARGVTDA